MSETKKVRTVKGWLLVIGSDCKPVDRWMGDLVIRTTKRRAEQLRQRGEKVVRVEITYEVSR